MQISAANIVRALVTVLSVGSVACGGEPSGPRGPKATSISNELAMALTPAALGALNSEGQFATATPDAEAGPQITEAQARAFATVFARVYAPHAGSYYRSQRLGPIDFTALSPCGRSMYAASRNQVSQPRMAERNLVGPKWIIALCGKNGERQFSVAVAALAVEMKVEDGRRFAFPGPHGNEFFSSGIPAEWDGAVSIDPEQAAVMAAQVTGHRVRSVPRLIVAGIGRVPHDAQWVIDLDGPVQVVGARPTDRVFVGPRLDGKSSLGRAGLAVQIPHTSAQLASAPASTLMSKVILDPEFPLGWIPQFTVIGKGGIIK